MQTKYYSKLIQQGYWKTIALLSAGYYFVIYRLYYRNNFTIFRPKGRQEAVVPSASPSVVSFLKVSEPTRNDGFALREQIRL